MFNLPEEPWRRELLIAVIWLAVGAFLLPVAIYLVGQQVVGEYAADGGMLGLAAHIWDELLQLRPAAWILVLSPYVVVMLLRSVRLLWRGRPTRVTTLTDSDIAA
jgi:hypothetical protein